MGRHRIGRCGNAHGSDPRQKGGRAKGNPVVATERGLQPTLITERLTLRPFIADDAFDVERLAGMREIADTTLNIPHPYPHGGAAAWIAAHAPAWNERSNATFAIIDNAAGRLAGAISLMIKHDHRRAELGYWIAVHSWKRGFATEASQRLIDFGFEVLGLHRIEARHFLRNPASGRVMQKLGMQQEGVERDWAIKWDRFESLAVYSILEPEWRASRHSRSPRRRYP